MNICQVCGEPALENRLNCPKHYRTPAKSVPLIGWINALKGSASPNSPKEIARVFGLTCNTVRKYLKLKGYQRQVGWEIK